MSKQTLFNLTLKTFLFLSPIFFFRDYSLSLARGMFFILGTFVLFGISLSLEAKRKFSNVWVSLFLLLAFIRMFFDNNLGNPQQEWFNFWLSCSGFIYVFCGVLLFQIVYCYAEDIKQYFKPIVYICVLNLLLTSIQIFNYDFMWTNAPSLCGFMGISSQLGQYSAMSIPILMFISPWLAIIPLCTLFMAKSVSSIVACAFGMAVFSVLRHVRKEIVIVTISILAIWLAFNFGYVRAKFQCRPIMWQKTLKVALQKPYLGWGYRTFQDRVVKTKAVGSIGGVEYSRAHNDYLHTAQELGFPIVIVIGGFFIGLIRKFKAKKNKDKLTYILGASVLIALINGCGQTLIRYASIASTFIILLAFFTIKLEGEKNDN